MSCMAPITGHPLAAFAGGPPLANALADELVLASRLLGDLAYNLGEDEATLRRHMTSIQAIDRITQMQLAIADLLRSEHVDAATIDALPLEEMVERITRALAGGGEPTPL